MYFWNFVTEKNYMKKNLTLLLNKFLVLLVISIFVNVHNAFAIDAPVNYIPNNTTEGVDFYTEFEWSKVVGARSYEIQIADNAEFTSPMQFTATSTFYTNYDLFTDFKYYWRVRAVDNSNQRSVWSEVWEFTTADYNAVPTPQLVSPFSGEKDFLQDVLLGWNFSIYHNFYEVQIAKDIDFTDIVISDNQLDIFYYYAEGLEFNTKYYWRVRAFGDNGESNWSVVWEFETATEGIELEDKLTVFGQNSVCINSTNKYVALNKQQYEYEWRIEGETEFNPNNIQYLNNNKSEINVSWTNIGLFTINLFRTNTNNNIIDSVKYDVIVTGPELFIQDTLNICGATDNTELTYINDYNKDYITTYNVLKGIESEFTLEIDRIENTISLSFKNLTENMSVELTTTDKNFCTLVDTVTVQLLPALDGPSISQEGNNLISSYNGGTLWFRNDEFYNYTQSNILSPKESGIYRCQYVHNELQCQSENSEPFEFIYSSVEDKFSNFGNGKSYFVGDNVIKLFSNELSSISHLSITGATELDKNDIRIYNAMGNEIKLNINKAELFDNQLEIGFDNFNESNALNSGFYSIIINNNNKVLTFNIIK